MGKQVTVNPCSTTERYILIDLLHLQIYRVGKLFCYIDRHVCMVSDGSFSNWKPVSLNHLLERSQTGIL